MKKTIENAEKSVACENFSQRVLVKRFKRETFGFFRKFHEKSNFAEGEKVEHGNILARLMKAEYKNGKLCSSLNYYDKNENAIRTRGSTCSLETTSR